MLFPDILSSVAGTAVTLSGFAAVFRAFGNSHDPDGQSRVRLNSVIEGGLLVVFVSYVPTLTVTLGYSEEIAWIAGCLIMVCWSVARIVVPTVRIFRAQANLPELFVPVVVAGIGALAVVSLTLVGAWPFGGYSGFLLALVLLLSNVGLVFIAQFRVEQTDDSDA